MLENLMVGIMEILTPRYTKLEVINSEEYCEGMMKRFA